MNRYFIKHFLLFKVEIVGTTKQPCKNEASNEYSQRASRSSSFKNLCRLHTARMMTHNACPACGEFCGEVRIIQCSFIFHCIYRYFSIYHTIWYILSKLIDLLISSSHIVWITNLHLSGSYLLLLVISKWKTTLGPLWLLLE